MMEFDKQTSEWKPKNEPWSTFKLSPGGSVVIKRASLGGWIVQQRDDSRFIAEEAAFSNHTDMLNWLDRLIETNLTGQEQEPSRKGPPLPSGPPTHSMIG